MKRSAPGATSGNSVLRRARRIALLVGLVAAVSCGQVGSQGTGETHFLAVCSASCADGFECLCGACTRACTDSLACAEFGAGAGCLPIDPSCKDATRTCDLACSADPDCIGLGSAYSCQNGRCRQGVPPDVITCAPGCREIRGYPLDSARSCFETDRETPIYCGCGEWAGSNECRRRLPDDAEFFALGTYPITSESPWVACRSAGSAAPTSCVFASCPVRPPSLCSFDDTCTALGCGGPEYDSAGCQRTNCTADTECTDDERCTLVSGANNGFCSPASDGTCQCAGPAAFRSAFFCNPVSDVGPRGAWQELRMAQDNGLCVPGACRDVWTFTPDGGFVHETGPADAPTFSQSLLSPTDLQSVRDAIDGPLLRKELSDGGTCESAEDGQIVFRLLLPDATLERDVTSCASLGGNAFATLYELAQRL